MVCRGKKFYLNFSIHSAQARREKGPTMSPVVYNFSKGVKYTTRDFFHEYSVYLSSPVQKPTESSLTMCNRCARSGQNFTLKKYMVLIQQYFRGVDLSDVHLYDITFSFVKEQRFVLLFYLTLYIGFSLPFQFSF